MADISLSASVRSSLLSLQNTTKLINRTQSRLSTGLEVGSAIDDPVKFFQAKSLSDRASDFDEKKDGIDQGISTLTAALDGAEGIEEIARQMKGLALNAKSATDATIGEIVSQFNDLRTQIANLATDTSYQGLNLINGTGSTLTVNFSTDTSSVLNVNSVDISEGGAGLAIRKAVDKVAETGSVLNVSYDFGTNVSLSDGGSLSVTYAGQSDLTFGSAGSYTFEYGSVTVSVSVGSATATTTTYKTGDTLSAGKAITFTIGSEGAGDGAGIAGVEGVVSAGTGAVAVDIATVEGQFVIDADYTTQINSMVNSLDSALETLRTKSQSLGSNVALLQTRLEFTESYVNTLQSGSDKLTLADLNEEGANLLALQTRQQLGISALSFAGQAEQGVLSLFR